MPRKKILIVDDDSSLLDILSARLKAAGFDICTAVDGLDALEKIQTGKPDLILTDVLMPRMTGFEFMRKVRGNPETRAIPALVTSAHSSVKVYFADISGIEFIPKAHEPKELLQKIRLILGEPVESLWNPL